MFTEPPVRFCWRTDYNSVSVYSYHLLHPLSSITHPVLLEGTSALNGRLICPCADQDVVISAIRTHTAFGLRTRAGVVGAKVLNNVVFNKRVSSPAVDGKVRVAVGVVRAGIVDCPAIAINTNVDVRQSHELWRSEGDFGWSLPCASWHPSLSTDKVTTALPVHGVGAAGAVGVGHVRTAIGPEGVVEAVVRACRAGSSGALGEFNWGALSYLSGGGEGAGHGGAGDKEGGERDHVD